VNLFLVGDDEALDVLAELSRHLDYFTVARLCELPSAPLGPDDHIVVGMNDHARGRSLFGALHDVGEPALARLIPELDGSTPGARAILVGAELVAALYRRPRG
jgi:hypothetical protein